MDHLEVHEHLGGPQADRNAVDDRDTECILDPP